MTYTAFEAKRLSKSSSISLKGPVEEVFPLFGPIRERDWAEGWNPHVLFPTNGMVEEHMVFKTHSHHGDHEPDYTWIISKFDPDQAFVEYTVFTMERLWWITIKCREDTSKSITHVEITYTYTGLTELGNTINKKALQQMYAHNLKDWEKAINFYLETGERLKHA